MSEETIKKISIPRITSCEDCPYCSITENSCSRVYLWDIWCNHRDVEIRTADHIRERKEYPQGIGIPTACKLEDS